MTPEAWLAWFGEHRGDVSVVADDGAGNSLRYNEDVPRVLASAIKVVHLLAYAIAVAEGRLDPEERIRVGDWDAHHPYGGDGLIGAGAHHTALSGLGVACDEYGLAKDPEECVPLGHIAEAMIACSDNAAPDYFRARLGDEALRDAAARAGWPDPDLRPFCGETILSYFPDHEDRYETHRTACTALAERFGTDPGFRRQVLARVDGEPIPAGDEWAWTRHTARGTAADLFALHQTVANERFRPAEAGAIARRILSLPLAHRVPAGAAEVLAKGGSLPHVLTAALDVRWPDGRAGTVVALLEDVPEGHGAALTDLCLGVLTEPARFADLTQALRPGSRPRAG